MRRQRTRLVSAALLASFLALAAQAHSLKQLEDQLGAREQYFQPVDRPAPDFVLQNAEGTTMGLGDFRGKVVVLHFIYTSCPDVCPLHTERIAELQALVNPTPMRDLVEFVSVSTDPGRDTPDVMREYSDRHGLDRSNWYFLTRLSGQAESATRELAERYGHKFTKDADGYQMHGIVTQIIDRQGRWRANFHGLHFQATSAVMFINALTNDLHGAHGDGTKGLWNWLRGLLPSDGH